MASDPQSSQSEPTRDVLHLAYDALYYLAEAKPDEQGRLTITMPIYDDEGQATGEHEPTRVLDEQDVYRARFALLAVLGALGKKEDA